MMPGMVLRAMRHGCDPSIGTRSRTSGIPSGRFGESIGNWLGIGAAGKTFLMWWFKELAIRYMKTTLHRTDCTSRLMENGQLLYR